MIIEKESKRFRFPKGGGFYAAVALAIIAAGVGVWGAVSNSLNSVGYGAPSDAVITAPTIDWADYVTRAPLTEPTEARVDNPVTNVADPREPLDAGATTAPPAAQKERMPYTGSFELPFGTKVSKDYSAGEMVKSKTMGDWRVHNGVDFIGAADDEVVAIQKGAVLEVGKDPLWGVVLTVDHGNGIIAKYCGLSENSTPKEGQMIEQGESIGVIAQIPSEILEGIHLHLEITVNGKVADPLAVMNKTGDNEQ